MKTFIIKLTRNIILIDYFCFFYNILHINQYYLNKEKKIKGKYLSMLQYCLPILVRKFYFVLTYFFL